MDKGRVPTLIGEPGAGAKTPVPSPSSTVTLLVPLFPTTMSGFLSPLKSPTAKERGALPTAMGEPIALL